VIDDAMISGALLLTVLALAVWIQIHPRIPTGSLASLALGVIALAALVRLGRSIGEIETTAWGVLLVVLLDILLSWMVPRLPWPDDPPPARHGHDQGRATP
jgi:hypothetical protein